LQLGHDMPRHPQGFSLAIFAFILGICCPPAQSAAAPGRAPAVASSVVADVIDLTNTERAHHRRAALRANPRLMRAAQLVFARPLS
jgi:uncharacterized protein YkwD